MDLEPEIVTPSQFFQRDVHSWPGERRLALAVLEEAVGTIFRLSRARALNIQAAHTLAEANLWLRSQDEIWPFSFLRCCYMIDVEPSYLRRGIAAALAKGKRITGWDWRRTPATKPARSWLSTASKKRRRAFAKLGVAARSRGNLVAVG